MINNAICSVSAGNPFGGGTSDGHGTMGRLVLDPLNCSILLPVELISFNAECQEDGVLLAWTTASESNNDHFLIERSLDGIEFQDIGRVYGAGNSMEAIDYSFVDQQPSGNLSYYRLKQTDVDGTFDYSPVVAIHCQVGGSNELLVWPNPATDLVHIRITDDSEPRQFIILDAHGTVVFQGSMVGSTTFRTEHLAMGMYVVKVQRSGDPGPTEHFTQRFIKH